MESRLAGNRGNDAGAFVGRTSFRLLAEHYIKADFGADAVRPKSVNTTDHVKCVLRKYLVPRFGDEIAEDSKPLDIQRGLKSLHEQNALAWTTIAKMRFPAKWITSDFPVISLAIVRK